MKQLSRSKVLLLAIVFSASVALFVPQIQAEGQCQAGETSKIINSTVVCVSQNQSQAQEQNNNQSQTNNNNQNVDINLNPSISNTNTININPSPVAGVVVVTQARQTVSELPKTGLPIAGVLLTSLVPVGAGLRKLKAKGKMTTPNTIWLEKQLQ